jgi:hypothetical protein
VLSVSSKRSTLMMIVEKVDIPVPYVEAAIDSAPYFLVKLVQCRRPGSPSAVKANSLCDAHRFAEHLPESIDATFALPL